MNRRLFVLQTAGTALAGGQTAPDKGPPLSAELVKESVIAGHAKLDKVKEMLARNAALIRAVWDWGGGDFETALGGAGHMGQREIAEFLIAQGAPIELPAVAMLGKLNFVKAAVAAFPNAANIAGPHGITVLTHAKKGGAQAEPVVRYLESLKT